MIRDQEANRIGEAPLATSFHKEEFPKNTIAVCISWKPETWSIPEVPFHLQVSNEQPYPRVKTRERVAHLANRRNQALEAALSSYPDTRHVLMVDSYYLAQASEIRKLLFEYFHRSTSGECIVGASTWFQDRTRILPRIRFWDNWITPEATNLRLPEENRGESLIPVKAVGACYIFPRRVWEIHPYGVTDHGGEHTSLCEESGLPVWLSLSVQLWRDPVVYSWTKRIRQTVHLGRVRSKSKREERVLSTPPEPKTKTGRHP